MTYAEKFLQWRQELRQLVDECLESDDPDVAQLVVAAIATLKQAHNRLADLGLDECEWLSEGKFGE